MQAPIAWAVGQKEPAWTIALERDDGKPVNLAGVSTNQLGFLVYNSSRQLTATGNGSFTIVSAARGLIKYAFGTNDVPSTAGTYYVRVRVNFNDSTPFLTDYIEWKVAS